MHSWLSPSVRVRIRSWLVKQWREWRWYGFFFCFVWVPLRSAVFDYSPVPTGSMNPTILEGDLVWVNKLAYGLRVPLTTHYLTRWAEPRRGDIVVVLSPKDGTRLVKRIVGVPGDVLELSAGRLHLNGRPLAYGPPAADYRATIAREWRPVAGFAEEDLGGVVHAVMGLARRAGAPRNFGPLAVPPGRYFLMGDNRDNSADSREFGFADREAILGRAGGILGSLDINDRYLPRPERFFTALR